MNITPKTQRGSADPPRSHLDALVTVGNETYFYGPENVLVAQSKKDIESEIVKFDPS